MGINYEKYKQSIINFGPTIEYVYNWNDKVEVNQKYTISWNSTSSKTEMLNSFSNTTYKLFTELVIREPKNFVWETNVEYKYFPSVESEDRNSNFLWNFELSYIFLKQSKGVLKFIIYDILDQNTGISQTISENYTQVTQTNLLQRYFLLSFTYNLRYFGPKKLGGKKSWFPF